METISPPTKDRGEKEGKKGPGQVHDRDIHHATAHTIITDEQKEKMKLSKADKTEAYLKMLKLTKLQLLASADAIPMSDPRKTQAHRRFFDHSGGSGLVGCANVETPVLGRIEADVRN